MIRSNIVDCFCSFYLSYTFSSLRFIILNTQKKCIVTPITFSCNSFRSVCSLYGVLYSFCERSCCLGCVSRDCVSLCSVLRCKNLGCVYILRCQISICKLKSHNMNPKTCFLVCLSCTETTYLGVPVAKQIKYSS